MDYYNPIPACGDYDYEAAAQQEQILEQQYDFEVNRAALVACLNSMQELDPNGYLRVKADEFLRSMNITLEMEKVH